MKKTINFLKKTTLIAALFLLVGNIITTIPVFPNESGICTLADSDTDPTLKPIPFDDSEQD